MDNLAPKIHVITDLSTPYAKQLYTKCIFIVEFREVLLQYLPFPGLPLLHLRANCSPTPHETDVIRETGQVHSSTKVQ